MWRDILIILAFMLALLTYFRLTPERLFRYARTARTEATKMTRLQKGRLIFVIALTVTFIFMIASGLVEFSLAIVLRIIAAVGSLWFYTLTEFFGLREKWGDKVFLATGLSFIALFIAGYALSDLTLLEKIVYPAATFGVACISVVVRAYIVRKREERRSSREETNKPNTTTK